MSRISSCPFRSQCVGAALAWLTPLAVVADDCPAPGQWQVEGGEMLTTAGLMTQLTNTRVVLLGEQHDRLDHHRWQLYTLAALHAHRPAMVIGLEMLPSVSAPCTTSTASGFQSVKAFTGPADQWRQSSQWQ